MRPDPAAVHDVSHSISRTASARGWRASTAAPASSGARWPRPEAAWPAPACSRTGPVIEKAAVNFSHTLGPQLPPGGHRAAAPALAGHPVRGRVSLSLIVHPRSPHAPTSHCEPAVLPGRRQTWRARGGSAGGFDLTPYYACDRGRRALAPDGARRLRSVRGGRVPAAEEGVRRLLLPAAPRRRRAASAASSSTTSTRAASSAPSSWCAAWAITTCPPIEPDPRTRRGRQAWTDEERAFQLYRRGRYAEFNLICDRGTRYGLQSGRRVESVLASMPPARRLAPRLARRSRDPPRPSCTRRFLPPRDWLDGMSAEILRRTARPTDARAAGAPVAARRRAADCRSSSLHGMGEHAARYAPLGESGSRSGRSRAGRPGPARSRPRAGAGAELGVLGAGGWPALVDDAARIFDEESSASAPGVPCVLMGHSMGSFVAQQLAVEGRVLRISRAGALRRDLDGTRGARLARAPPSPASSRGAAADATRAARCCRSRALRPLEPGVRARRATGYEWLSRDPEQVELGT